MPNTASAGKSHASIPASATPAPTASPASAAVPRMVATSSSPKIRNSSEYAPKPIGNRSRLERSTVSRNDTAMTGTSCQIISAAHSSSTSSPA